MGKTKVIKAIQTEYNGIKFRSRLEARWAVFFDAANIKYEYEVEGFELENGDRYLPDFYLPDLDLFVEVKRDTEEGRKQVADLERFIQWGGGIKELLILSDIPKETVDGGRWAFPIIRWEGNQPVWRWFCFWGVPGEKEIYGCVCEQFGISTRMHFNPVDKKTEFVSIGAVSDERLNDARRYQRKIRQIERILGYRDDFEVEITVEERIEREKADFPLFYAALDKARKARFEFGETPTKEE